MSIVKRQRELKELVAAAHRRRRTNDALAVQGIADVAKSTKRLIGKPNQKGRTHKSWLITAGVALVALPDPIGLDLVGTALIGAGLLKNRLRRPTVVDVYQEIRDSTRQMENIMRQVHY